MPTNKKSKDNTTKESARKPLPQSSIASKRKEIFNLNTTKDKKGGDN